MSGNTDGIFGVSGDTIIIINPTNLNFEVTSGYSLLVSGSDGLFSDSATIDIEITNTNDNAPVVDDATGSIAENAIT
jgi:hypothetical protein